jgi:uncharacterized protein YidB (DUF937 family)
MASGHAAAYDRLATSDIPWFKEGDMSLLNDLLGGKGTAAGGAGSKLGIAQELLQRAGGVQGLVAMLKQHGQEGAVQSWISSGANQPVSGDQLGQALQGGGMGGFVQEAASKLGVDPSTVLGGLSQLLPHAVDHLTPDGQLPAAGEGTGSGFNLGALEGLAGKLFS